MARYLIVANQTIGGEQLTAKLEELVSAGSSGRLEHELARLRRSGIEASGEVVDALPVDRAQELLHQEHFDGVVVSTLPRRLSRWLIRDLPHRIAGISDVPVTHVEGNAGPSL